MFTEFLTAGSLETQKILNFMVQNESYLVPMHEFVKSTMLLSKKYYSERHSHVSNVFAVGDIERPSHFTRLRILQWLYERRHESSFYGRGFHQLGSAKKYFHKIGISEKDVETSHRILTESFLIENDLRAIKNYSDAQAIRLTPTGRYYLIKLHRKFEYIDLVMQDTPFFNREVFDQIEVLCDANDMKSRFERCEIFLNYLEDQEEEELITIEKISSGVTWRPRFVPTMKRSFQATKEFIIEKDFK